MSSSQPPPPPSAPQPVAPPRAWTFIGRALRLQCPECGRHPIFVPARKVRSLFDWFYPLDGCPQCGYAYEREQGYFLLATWAVNYGVVGGVGVTVGVLMQEFTHLSFWAIAGLLLIVMPMVSFLFARHAKALYLAMDHYFDPHLKPR
jgi:uncharacterized protein (DUF983 family)